MIYTQLQHGTPEYKECLKDAILKRDIDVLTQIKAKPSAPIHLVQNWFAYALMKIEAVVIYTNETKADLNKLLESCK